ncbi:TetR/AcrR family transcriptional regulator [Nocardia heshunensis]
MTKGPAPGPTTRPSADATRERILAAALDLFSTLSYDGASMREIASRAGVTQPLLNYHFSSKEELWRTAVDGLFDTLGQAISNRSQGLRGVDELTVAKLLVREYIYFAAEHPELTRIVNQENKADSSRMDWLVEKHVRPFYNMATAMFGHLVSTGDMPDIPTEYAYYILTGAGTNMFVLGPECHRLSGVDPTAREVIEGYADAIILFLFGTQGRHHP